MKNEKLVKGNRYNFVILGIDVFNAAEILNKYLKNGFITLLKFQSFCKDIYQIKQCYAIQEQHGFLLLFYGENMVQDAIEVTSTISSRLEFFNKTISLIPYNIEPRSVIGRSSLIFESNISKMINRDKNHVYRIRSQSSAGEILITDNIYSQLSSNQRRYFYFDKLFDRYILYKADTTFSFTKCIQEATNVNKIMMRISEKFKHEIINFSIEKLDLLIDIYKHINILNILNKIILAGNDLEFFSENLSEGYKFLSKLKETEIVIKELVDFVEKNCEQNDDRLFIVFAGISNQLAWCNDIKLNDEIEKLEFILENRKHFGAKKLGLLFAERNESICNNLIETLINSGDQHQQYLLVKRIIYMYVDELILYIISLKACEQKQDALVRLRDILWKHLYLFYSNNSQYQNIRSSFTQVPYISKNFEDFLLILGKKNLTNVVKIVEKYDDYNRGIIAKALSFHRDADIVSWSIKNIQVEDLWELVASPEVPLPKLWQIYNEILNRVQSGTFEKTLFFTCVFEKIKTEMIRTNSFDDIKLIEKFLNEFIKSDFSMTESYSCRLDELKVLYKHKIEVLNKADNIFERVLDSISRSIKSIGFKKETDSKYSIDTLRNLKPWVQLQLAKHGFFSTFFVCQQGDINIARAAFKRLQPSDIANIFTEGFQNPNIFFELANISRLFNNSVNVKALFKYKLSSTKHYTMYRKFLRNADLEEIKHYTNQQIKSLIDIDLTKKR